MKRTGIATLPLHYGTAPRWLFKRMVKLARGIATVLVEEYSSHEFLHRISDAFWFQALACTLGFDWHSSGTTTVTCGALKEALDPTLGITVCGGKGKASRKVPEEIERASKSFALSAEDLKYRSRMCAKVDNTALQDEHQLYHHAFFITAHGEWAVVQQGMCSEYRTARRYHWFSESVRDMVEEPHKAILSELRIKNPLNLTARQSRENKNVSVDLVRESPKKLSRLLRAVRKPGQQGLEKFIDARKVRTLKMPMSMHWKAIRKAYELQPTSYEDLLSIKGIGPKTVRALALIAELVYGEQASWKDPAIYSFAVGGKDGVPYPVNKKVMDQSINILEEGIEEAKVGNREKLRAIRRLNDFRKR